MIHTISESSNLEKGAKVSKSGHNKSGGLSGHNALYHCLSDGGTVPD